MKKKNMRNISSRIYMINCLMLLLLLSTLQTFSQSYSRLKNRHLGNYLHTEYGKPELKKDVPKNWYSAMWELEPVPNTNYVRLKSRHQGKYLHTEYGKPELIKDVPKDWYSAMWELKPVVNTNYVRLKSRHLGNYLHTENGKPELKKDIPENWYSTMWIIESLETKKDISNNLAVNRAALNPTSNDNVLESEYVFVSVELTGIRSTFHNEECRSFGGTLNFYLVDNSESCPKTLDLTLGKRRYKGLGYANSHDSWKTNHTIGNWKRNSTPNNIGFRQVYKIKSDLIKNKKTSLKVYYFIRQCHRDKGDISLPGDERSCSVLYNTPVTGKKIILKDFVDNKIETYVYDQGVSYDAYVPQHEIKFFFKIELFN